MDADAVLHIGREALMLTLILSAAPVLATMAVGLTISLFQAATQIQEQTLTFVPKIVAMVASAILLMPWIGHRILEFTALMLGSFY